MMRLHGDERSDSPPIIALAGASVADTASASRGIHSSGPLYFPGGDYFYGNIEGSSLNRAPQPDQSPPGATSRPSNRDMRGAPPIGARRAAWVAA